MLIYRFEDDLGYGIYRSPLGANAATSRLEHTPELEEDHILYEAWRSRRSRRIGRSGWFHGFSTLGQMVHWFPFRGIREIYESGTRYRVSVYDCSGEVLTSPFQCMFVRQHAVLSHRYETAEELFERFERDDIRVHRRAIAAIEGAVLC